MFRKQQEGQWAWNAGEQAKGDVVTEAGSGLGSCGPRMRLDLGDVRQGNNGTCVLQGSLWLG